MNLILKYDFFSRVCVLLKFSVTGNKKVNVFFTKILSYAARATEILICVECLHLRLLRYYFLLICRSATIGKWSLSFLLIRTN